MPATPTELSARIHTHATKGRLTTCLGGLKYQKTPQSGPFVKGLRSQLSSTLVMSPKPLSPPSPPSNQKPCKHPRVQIVRRDEEEEYVECMECREIFEASEFKDMSIEESAGSSDEL